MENRRLPVLANHDACSGCKACGEVCPQTCISFNMGNDGFWYPQINHDACIGCHACERACPVITPKNLADKLLPRAYAAWTEEKARHKSTSGGAFYAMAKAMIQNGGYVSGAVFDGARVKHIVTNRNEDLSRIQGTKYFQSDTTGVFKEIRRLLREGKKVLFGGTSCQVAGLLNVVGEKSDNLITIDLICYGVPSSLIIGVEERIRGKKLKRLISSRDKDHDGGWRNSYYMTCEWDDGTTTVTPQKDSFMLGSFCSGKVMRNSCYRCPYKTIYRQADLTIGDYHCVQGYDEQRCEGISLVFVNSEKGSKIFESCTTMVSFERDLCESLPHKRTIYFNDAIYGRRLERVWMPQLLRHAPFWMLSLLYQNNGKSKNPLRWPFMVIDAFFFVINSYKAKRELNELFKIINK